MEDTLKVPRGYEEYKKKFLKRLKKGEIVDLDESKKKDLFYVA